MSNILYSMAYAVCAVIVLVISQFSTGHPNNVIQPNDRPIIGILSQELSVSLREKYGKNFTSYIAASYVKFLEGAGARVVPIWINKSRDYYENIILSVNGVLFPGGSASLKDSGYGVAGRIIYDLASSLNDKRDYFPLWGTCLGFELITYLGARKDVLSNCSGMDIALPLIFKDGYRKSKLFREASEDITSLLATKNLTSNFHRFCLTEREFVLSALDAQYNILSISKDRKNKQFISAIEGKIYPFYGVQFHPEKNSYEWNTQSNNIPHSADAIRVCQYFAEFFVNEARKNSHKFSSVKQESNSLIYNYQKYYTGREHLSFEECYLFEE